tara:strand:+ start:349 stop:1155 length:807 start_codon:yes stop_codon:yes gene_type:complete
MSIKKRILENLKNGTILKNGLPAFKNRLYKTIKTSNFFYLFNVNRVKTKKYLESIRIINKNHFKVGNYYLDSRIMLNEQSIVYSLGILNDVSFDEFIAKKFSCQVFMYDPTPLSIEFLKSQKNSKFNFFPFGVWIEESIMKFYEPKFGGSSSIFNSNNYVSDRFFEAKCYTIKQLMEKNNHTNIDVFKADIEGAALPILEQMIDQKILPTQIIVEFERPKKDINKINDFFQRVDNLRKVLSNYGYEEFRLPRKSAKYFSLELLFTKSQ